MEAQLKQEIEGLVQAHRVVLFMKGSKNFPQCGFSATVVNLLRQAGVSEFKDINILQRPDLREGIKEYASWPTIPQLYIEGQFVGGCDIVRELFTSGELFSLLGTKAPEVKQPAIRISDAARAAIIAAAEGESGGLRIEISPQYQYALSIDEPKPGDVTLELGELRVLLDRESAARAEGLRIDYSDQQEGGFTIESPNEPPKVSQISVRELKTLLDQGAIELLDVRTSEERAKACIAGSQLFDQEAQAKLAKLDRNTPLYFVCHHGGRSQQAADLYRREGFKRVYNVSGGIDAWSREIDPSVARY